MTHVAAIGVNNKQYVVAGLSDRLHPSFAVVSPIVLLLQSETAEIPRCIIEAEPSLAQGAPALGLVPLEEHDRSYAL